MKRYLAIVAALFIAQPVFAFQCPADMAGIDAALAANPTLTAEQLAEVQAFRAEGEAMHTAGKHDESMAALKSAKDILGIE